MNCQQAQRLFDAYLDGELSPALATELGAHRVQCAECRRALALLEVSGHIIASDRDPGLPHGGLADRLAACMDERPIPRALRLRRAVYIAGPLAAAAVIALAFLGFFDHQPAPIIAGKKIEKPREHAVSAETPPISDAAQHVPSVDERLLRDWIERTRRNVAAKRESGETLQQAFDQTIGQLLDVLEKARDESSDADHYPAADTGTPRGPDTPAPAGDHEEVEDL
jgi:hypothetical protein